MQHLQAALWQTRSQIAGMLRHHHRKQLQAHAASGGCSFRWLQLQVDAAAGSIVANNIELSNKCMYMKLCIDVCIQQQWGSTSSGLV